MEQVLSYTLISASVLLVCKKAYELCRSFLGKCVEVEVKCNRKRLMSEQAAQYNEAKVYSICLSIDYQKNRKTKNDNKAVLNKVVYSKIENLFKKKVPAVQTRKSGDVLIVTSWDFNSYDEVYDSILKTLSKVQSEIFQRYHLNLIPSITTDAYKAYPNTDKIMKNHNNIKHCNFANKACATKAFSKKYELENHHKYMGVPIGEYSIIDVDQEKTYNLNMVNRNLSSMLEMMR